MSYADQHRELPRETTVRFLLQNIECTPIFFDCVLHVPSILYVHLTLLHSLVSIFQLQ
jgi:hypothetical protein